MSSARTKNELLTMEEWKELGEMLKDWEPYTEHVRKRSKSEVEKYMSQVYGVDCSMIKKADFFINKVVHRTVIAMSYRGEWELLGLPENDGVRSRITGQIDSLLRQGSGEFSKKPVRNMRGSDRRMLELCEKYLKSVGLWLE